MSLLFSQQKFPMLVASISDSNPQDVICTIRNAILDGADGFMLHLEKMKQEHLNEEDLRKIIDHTCDKPIYTMNYRLKDSADNDQQLIDAQLTAIKAGATMIDMMGDMFDRSPLELTRNPKAIEQQKQIIAQVHEMGAEVLMSSHTYVYMTTEEVLAHATELENRGADFVKIAMSVNSQEEMVESLKTTAVVSKALGVPFLHICMGPHGKLHRAIGPLFGSCFALCVQSYTSAGHKDKVLLRAEKCVLDNIDSGLNRSAYR